MSRFVDPVEVRLPISDGDYLIVKETLTTGERLEMFARMRAGGQAPPTCPHCQAPIEDEARIDDAKFGPAIIGAYLLDWTLTDRAGQLVSIREQPRAAVVAAIEQLEYEDYQEILEAIQVHEDKVKAARQEKKQRTGPPASERTYPSPVAVIGATSG